MKLKFFIFFSLLVQQYLIHVDGLSIVKQCDTPTLKNGRIRLRGRGKYIRFECFGRFKLIGVKNADCLKGRWDNPVPICIQSGCEPQSPIENGFIDTTTHNEAVAILSCLPNFEVAGQTKSNCDGQEWDRTLGVCRAVQSLDYATHCDFEVANICGWISDSSNNYDWNRQSGSPIGTRLRVIGPMFDHTTKERLHGHFMIAENINREENDTARLISPMYRAEQSKDACFRFHSHIFGKSAGQLSIWMKPASIHIRDVLGNIKYLQFVRTGDFKNNWVKNIIEINTYSENFQIIIEAKSKGSGLSDIAIDDVALLQGVECLNDEDLIRLPPTKEEMTETTVIEPGIYDIQSCVNRCNELPTDDIDSNTNRQSIIQNGSASGSIVVLCSCFNGCDALQLCCLDYMDVCVFDSTTEVLEDYSSEEPIGVQTEPNLPTNELTTSLFRVRNTTIIPITTTLAVKLTTKPTTPTTTERIRTIPTTSSLKTTKATTIASTSTVVTTQRLTTTPITTFKSTIITKKQTDSTSKIPTKLTTTTSTARTPTIPLIIKSVTQVIKEIVTEKSIIAIEPIITTEANINDNNIKSNTTNNTEQHWHSANKRTDSDKLSSNLLLIFSLVAIFVLIIISGIVLFKKYHHSSDYRSNSKHCVPSDEVKFLTSNEQLDYEYTSVVTN